MHMKIFEIFLWPGTKFCEYIEVDPTADAGLIRWMVNTLVYLFVSLMVLWAVVV